MALDLSKVYLSSKKRKELSFIHAWSIKVDKKLFKNIMLVKKLPN